jgi:quercetin dioxygenase-like cupin family protein
MNTPTLQPDRPGATRKKPFDRLLEAEGLKLVGGYAVDDLRTVPLAPWDRLGAPAAYVHLEGGNGFVGVMVGEIPPGGHVNPLRHLYEEQILILNGQGTSQIWSEDQNKALTVEWQAGSVFSPPLNTWHQMFNGSGTEKVRWVAASNAPMVFNIFRNPDFVFNAPYAFEERFDGRNNYFDTEFRASEEEDTSVNFIPDVFAVPLTSHEERGRGYSRLGINLSGNAMNGHIGSFEVGTYKKAHRHGGGAQVIILDGIGFSLIWPPDGKLMKIPWHAGSLLVPPEGWYHEHFNTGPKPARVLALRRGFRGLGPDWFPSTPTREGGHQLEYEDEPEEIRPMFEEELKKNGVEIHMQPIRRGR